MGAVWHLQLRSRMSSLGHSVQLILVPYEPSMRRDRSEKGWKVLIESFAREIYLLRTIFDFQRDRRPKLSGEYEDRTGN